jgi:hypothetical protein
LDTASWTPEQRDKISTKLTLISTAHLLVSMPISLVKAISTIKLTLSLTEASLKAEELNISR